MHTGLMTEESLHTRDLVELENEYGAHNYNPLEVVIERARGVSGLRRRGQPLSGLPGCILGGQPGPSPIPKF